MNSGSHHWWGNWRNHWLGQRLSAVGLLLAGAALAANAEAFRTHSAASEWLTSPLGMMAAAVFAVSLFIHSHLGITNIVADYVRNRRLKSLLNRASYGYAVLGTIASLLSLMVL